MSVNSLRILVAIIVICALVLIYIQLQRQHAGSFTYRQCTAIAGQPRLPVVQRPSQVDFSRYCFDWRREAVIESAAVLIAGLVLWIAVENFGSPKRKRTARRYAKYR